MPSGAGLATRCFHSVCKTRAEFIAPAPDRFIAHNNPALEQQLFDVAKAQLKPEIPANGTTDHCAWEAMTVIKRFCFRHRAILRDHPANVTESFFSTPIRHQGQSPETITLNGYVASHRAVREMKADSLLPADTQVRSSKYLNNLIEQDHRHIKSRTNVMLGFKRFRSATTTISGIELMHRIREGQFDLTKLGLKEAAAPAVWNATLSDR
jgi:DDE domain